MCMYLLKMLNPTYFSLSHFNTPLTASGKQAWLTSGWIKTCFLSLCDSTICHQQIQGHSEAGDKIMGLWDQSWVMPDRSCKTNPDYSDAVRHNADCDTIKLPITTDGFDSHNDRRSSVQKDNPVFTVSSEASVGSTEGYIEICCRCILIDSWNQQLQVH